jgi:23S rRNA (uracil1939-C5)-methyltransferase
MRRPKTPRRLVVLEATLDELAPGGDGVAHADVDGERRAVFVPGVARGERVRIEVDLGTRPARGVVLSLLARSPARVTPACAFVDRCGGCDWMHLSTAEQAAEHERIVRQLLNIGQDDDVRVTAHAAEPALAYRTRARLHVVAHRRKKEAALVGIFGRRSHEPVVVDTCVVLDPRLDRLRGELGDWLAGAEGHGEAQISLGAPTSPTSKDAERRTVLDLRFRGELPAALFGRLETEVVNGPLLAGARVFAGEVKTPATIGDPTPYLVAADGLPLRLAPGGFAQATEAGNARLAGAVAELARALRPGPAVELHAGAANHTVLLARDRVVTAVERDAEACAAARANLEARGLLASGSASASARARVTEADADAYARTIPKGTALVVLDPPREGAREVASALAQRPARARPDVIYVSCDPATLARDVKILRGAGYVLRSVDTFEMFPQTSHVETIAVLSHGQHHEPENER